MTLICCNCEPLRRKVNNVSLDVYSLPFAIEQNPSTLESMASKAKTAWRILQVFEIQVYSSTNRWTLNHQLGSAHIPTFSPYGNPGFICRCQAANSSSDQAKCIVEVFLRRGPPCRAVLKNDGTKKQKTMVHRNTKHWLWKEPTYMFFFGCRTAGSVTNVSFRITLHQSGR